MKGMRTIRKAVREIEEDFNEALREEYWAEFFVEVRDAIVNAFLEYKCRKKDRIACEILEKYENDEDYDYMRYELMEAIEDYIHVRIVAEAVIERIVIEILEEKLDEIRKRLAET